MKELLDKIRSNILSTLKLEYDINTMSKKLIKDINQTVNDGFLESEEKYEFIQIIIKETLNGSKEKNKTGRFDIILKRIDQKIKEYETKDLDEENINKFIEELETILTTSKMSLLLQDKELIKRNIKDYVNEYFVIEEKNKINNMLNKYSIFDEDYESLMTNKIIDIKNSITFTINRNNN